LWHESVGVVGHEDHVDVIGHQHPAPHFDARRRRMNLQQRLVQAEVGRRKESLLPTIAALRHMMRNAGNDEAGEAGHIGWLASGGQGSNK
jgi:metallophosphoesterase superfamily enzyme